MAPARWSRRWPRSRGHDAELDFVVQTTVTRGNVDEIPRLVAWSAEKGAVSFNCYFVVATGRAEGMRGLTPMENDEVLVELVRLGAEYRGRMMVRSKCQPQIMRHAHTTDPESGLLDYATRCPCGVQYCRITPDGKVTPCPYMPVEAGNLAAASFGEIWRGSRVFRELRTADLGGPRPLRIPGGVRGLSRARLRGVRRLAGRGSRLRL